MADIPGTVPSFEDLEDDVDFVEAEDQNNPNDEIEALATEVGMFGAGLTQADGVDLIEAFRKARQSFRLSFDDVDNIDISQGEVVCVNAAETQRVPRKNGSVDSINFTADLDTGARAQDTTYYVYAVADAAATTVTFLISESATTPTGATRFTLIGKFATNATGSGEIIETSVVSVVGEVVVQTHNFSTGDVASGTTAIPADSLIPQIDEGDEYMVLPALPSDADNRIEVQIVLHGSNSQNDYNGTVSLFRDAVVDALNNGKMTGTSGVMTTCSFLHSMLAGTTDLITFRVRAGSTSGTFTFNGVSGSQVNGGTLRSSITVKEYRKVYR